MRLRALVVLCLGFGLWTQAAWAAGKKPIEVTKTGEGVETMQKTDEEWRKELTPEQYQVMRQKGTERPFTGKYWNNKETGMYHCAACGAPLFSSKTKFESGTGWPSFEKPEDEKNIRYEVDTSHGMRRVEVICKRCGAHLGHVFDDGPTKTGKRFCINSCSLDFKKEQKHKE